MSSKRSRRSGAYAAAAIEDLLLCSCRGAWAGGDGTGRRRRLGGSPASTPADDGGEDEDEATAKGDRIMGSVPTAAVLSALVRCHEAFLTNLATELVTVQDQQQRRQQEEKPRHEESSAPAAAVGDGAGRRRRRGTKWEPQAQEEGGIERRTGSSASRGRVRVHSSHVRAALSNMGMADLWDESVRALARHGIGGSSTTTTMSTEQQPRAAVNSSSSGQQKNGKRTRALVSAATRRVNKKRKKKKAAWTQEQSDEQDRLLEEARQKMLTTRKEG